MCNFFLDVLSIFGFVFLMLKMLSTLICTGWSLETDKLDNRSSSTGKFSGIIRSGSSPCPGSKESWKLTQRMSFFLTSILWEGVDEPPERCWSGMHFSRRGGARGKRLTLEFLLFISARTTSTSIRNLKSPLFLLSRWLVFLLCCLNCLYLLLVPSSIRSLYLKVNVKLKAAAGTQIVSYPEIVCRNRSSWLRWQTSSWSLPVHFPGLR